jgi:hypothetical protein
MDIRKLLERLNGLPWKVQQLIGVLIFALIGAVIQVFIYAIKICYGLG